MAINWILFVGGMLLAALGLIYVLDVRGVGTRGVISYRENWLWGRSKRWLDSPDGNQIVRRIVGYVWLFWGLAFAVLVALSL